MKPKNKCSVDGCIAPSLPRICNGHYQIMQAVPQARDHWFAVIDMADALGIDLDAGEIDEQEEEGPVSE